MSDDEEAGRLISIKEDDDDIVHGLNMIATKSESVGNTVSFPSPLGHAALDQSIDKTRSAMKAVDSHIDYLPPHRR